MPDSPSQPQPRAHLGLERLRAQRVRPDRDLTLTAILDSESANVRKQSKAAAAVRGAWDGLLESAGVPKELSARARTVSLRAGVLTIRVADASTKFALDRFLRAGGERTLVRLSSAPLKRVKLTL